MAAVDAAAGSAHPTIPVAWPTGLNDPRIARGDAVHAIARQGSPLGRARLTAAAVDCLARVQARLTWQGTRTSAQIPALRVRPGDLHIQFKTLDGGDSALLQLLTWIANTAAFKAILQLILTESLDSRQVREALAAAITAGIEKLTEAAAARNGGSNLQPHDSHD